MQLRNSAQRVNVLGEDLDEVEQKMVGPTDVVAFWIDEVGPEGWYRKDPDLDGSIRDRFMEIWQVAATADSEGRALEEWFETPEAILGLLILLDQFPRNMFREDPRAFSTDARARAVAKKAIEKGWDQRVPLPQRQFFYLPLMHSECLMDQDRAIRLIKTRMESESSLLHAKAHREIIRRFGRFPFRNNALSRETTDAETEFLDQGGYGTIVQELQSVAA